MGTNTAKPYKVQEDGGLRRIGITAVNMKDLRKKASMRLNNIAADHRLCLLDGTEVQSEKYFKSLPTQTCFTFVSPAKDGNLQSDLLQLQKLTQKIFHQLSQQQANVTNEVRDLLTQNNSEMVSRVLLDYVSSIQSNIDAELREEDELWFEDLPKTFKTKEDVMRAGAKSRVRNYCRTLAEYVDKQV